MLSDLGRRICKCTRVGTNKKCVAELIVNGNQIEFYAQDNGNASPDVFIGGDIEHKYKVVTNGLSAYGSNKTLNLSCSYNVRYALMQNFAPDAERETNNIIGFSFMIPELMDWFYGIRTTELFVEEKQICASEIDLPSLILKQSNPKIKIEFESSSFNETLRIDSRTQTIIKKEPRISVVYENSVDVEKVRQDIKVIMQFWGLMIGMVSDALDIRLDIKDSEFHSWLYLNGDFSYNTYAHRDPSHPRTTLKTIDDKITEYFTNWYEFCCNSDYNLIRNIYFATNNRNTIFAEDVFVSYIKILEGYHLRISNDEIYSERLKESVNKLSKEIKNLIFAEEGKDLFSKVLTESLPEWKFTSPHAKEISFWISTGYLSHSTLESRIKSLDDSFFCILAKNASIITDRSGQPQTPETIKLYYEKLVATRNYYSHLKNDKKKLLSFHQINDSIFALKALIIMIFFYRMGVDLEKIREIMCWDSELSRRTCMLRNKGEKSPFT